MKLSNLSLLAFSIIAALLQIGSARIFFRRPSSYNTFMRKTSVPFEKAKVETLGDIFKRHVQHLRHTPNKQVELVFLIDSSGTVGRLYFYEEIRFVKNLLADFTVDVNSTRVSVITFSSPHKIFRHIDYLTQPDTDNHKCRLLLEDIPHVDYTPGGTHTLGAFLEAEKVLKSARPDAAKAIFLMTDGYSNGGDPRPIANKLKKQGVKIFTFGIRDGFVWELQDMASEPKNETCYILDSFEEFEALARRALHADLQSGTYIKQTLAKCSKLCSTEGLCCHDNATCACGSYTGRYECLCKPGFYGTGRGKTGCKPCPPGRYKNFTGLGDINVCTPCPDEHQTTPVGAVSQQECVCKRGYRSFGSKECTVFRCPELSPPKYGYFVNNKCNSVFNAACGLRCQHGYELRGSSLRICQDDGAWSGQDAECIMKTCPSLPPPKNGHMICSSDDFSYSTVCRFTCNAGYQLVGSRKRTCLAIAYWTGIATRCREITCPPLVEIKDGTITPTSCTSREVVFGSTCQISCSSGYTLKGPHTKQCTPDGTWMADEGGVNQCIDESPPFLRCPNDIEVVADEFEEMTEVTWATPVPVDNSGFRPVLTSDPVVTPGSKFPQGVIAITYKAEDLNNNVAKCTFTITVIDTTPPTIDKCISPPPIVSKLEKTDVVMESPLFSDNSGKPVEVVPSHRGGEPFPWGTTTVTYQAFDSSNNNVTCSVEVVVIPHLCVIPESPVNGNVSCEEGEIGVLCLISCSEGFAFAVPPAEEYFCAYEDGRWLPEENFPFPDCAVAQITNDILQPATISLMGELACKDRVMIQKLEIDLEESLEKKLTVACENELTCSVGSLKSVCEDEEDFNKIQVVPDNKKRKKRSVREYLERARERRDLANKKSRITFDMMFEGSLKEKQQSGTEPPSELSESLMRMLISLQKEARLGNLDLRVGGRLFKFSGMFYDLDLHTYRCPEGSILVNETCVNCPVGTFFHVIHERCEDCPKGTYQPMEGHNSCLRCPDNMSTPKPHSRDLKECKALCLPGTSSFNGLEPCETCHLGFYQSDYSARFCRPCTPGMTTHRRGSRREEDCSEICSPGYASQTGLAPCFPCPRNSYQPKSGQMECLACPAQGTTTFSAATAEDDCIYPAASWEIQSDNGFRKGAKGSFFDQQRIPFNVCFDEPCENGGTCATVKGAALFKCFCPKGFTGKTCENVLDMCEAQPCHNGGTCDAVPGGFKCHCQDGFTGTNCAINVDECASNPCENKGICVDGINTFTCNCLPGYTDPTCSSTVNDCADTPCQNGGTCENYLTGFMCHCPPGFSGETCEIDLDECISAPCENGGSCTDLPAKFSCKCVRGYTGSRCETEINECAYNPCQNGATCEDLLDNYKCLCLDGYTGKKCEKALTSQYQLDFVTPSIMDYAELSIDQPLTSVTVSFWIRTSDTVNQGTPFSYAVHGEPNAFTVTDYQNLNLIVNGEQLNIGIQLNDGKWHHVVLTWASQRGDWKAYIDGVLRDQDYNLSTNKPIPGKGKFIVGQEQDTLGGGFSPSETFVGSLTQLNVWDEELSLQSIEDLRFSCEGFQGNVIAWPDVQQALKGDVGSTTSNFCQDCPTPTDPLYGTVTFSSTSPGSEAEYTCNAGYYIAGNPFLRCLISGEYDEQQPECVVINCGRPGPIRNGYVVGRDFTFDKKVRIRCNKGFEIDGASELTCTEWGEWDEEKPKCVEIQCDLPELSENTIASSKEKRFPPGSRVDFSCKLGSSMQTGHTSVTCQRDGSWDKSVPTCDPEKCGVPPAIDDGQPVSANPEYNVGDILRYQCDYGHEFSDTKKSIACQPGGEWESEVPVCGPIQCPDPPFVPFAMANGDGRVFTSVVNYTCRPGFKLKGKSSIKCEETRDWTKPSFRCIMVTCPKPPSIPFGRFKGSYFFSPNSYKYNDLISYQCDQGYSLTGQTARRCLGNGTWSGSEPSCDPVSCGELEDIEHGSVIYSDTNYLSTAQYSCNQGFELTGFAERICEASGSWAHDTPVCLPRACPIPDDIDSGTYKASGALVYNTTVEYSCYTGYMIVGDAVLLCQEDGTWSTSAPTCEEIQCPPLEDPEHGSVVAVGRTFASIADYKCEKGFRRIGTDVRTCQIDGTWSDEAPTCQATKCATPQDLENGNVQFKDLSVGSIVKYNCRKGFSLVGETIRRCLDNLTLSGLSPVCEHVDCGDAGKLTNGQVILSGDGTRFLSVATFSCNEGYELKGDSTRICEADGRWSGALPECTMTECPELPKQISHGHINSSDSMYGTVIDFQCHEGYRLDGPSTRKCLVNGTWDGSLPSCEAIMCPLPKLFNGFVSTLKRTYGTKIKFSCNKNYRLSGPSERTCMDTAEWSGDEPKCLRISCDVPEPVAHSKIIVVNDTAIQYACKKGYNLVGNPVRICGENEIWTPEAPICKISTCKDLSKATLEKGKIQYTSNKFRDKVSYSCNSGYTLTGEEARRCLSNGSWSGEDPACVKVSCGHPGIVINGYFEGDQYTHESSVRFFCKEGYRVIGNENITCNSDGLWDQLPYCELITCPQLDPAIPNGSVRVTANTLSGTAEYECQKGLELVGEAVRVCLDSGEWSGKQPVCTTVSCTPPDPVEYGIMEGDKFGYGDAITYTCEPGYDLYGDFIRICQADGTWSNSAPRCIPITCPEPGWMRYGYATGTGGFFKDVQTIECFDGYEVKGPKERVCLSNATWSGEEPDCVPISCGEPPAIENAYISQRGDLLYESRVVYACNEGYRLFGVDTTECLANRTWAQIDFSCIIIQCPSFTAEDVPHAVFDVSNLNYGSNVTFECEKGYELSGSSLIACTEAGVWSDYFPNCLIIQCPKLAPLDFGSVNSESNDYGSLAFFSCNTGYELIGAWSLQCLSSGLWNDSQPFCQIVTCTPPAADIPNGYLDNPRLEYVYRDTCSYSCEFGYQLEGDNLLTCMETGEFDLPPPKCVRIPCASPVEIEFGQFTEFDNYTVVYECQTGFELVGNAILECNLGGIWSGLSPVCVPIVCPPPPILVNGWIESNELTFGQSVQYHCDEGFQLEGLARRMCQANQTWSGEEPECVPVQCGRPPEEFENGFILGEFHYGEGIEYVCNPGFYVEGESFRLCSADGYWEGEAPECLRDFCDAPNEIENGYITGSSYLFNDTIVYSCDAGFELQGDAERVCEASLAWSGFEPFCVRISCGVPTAPANGIITGDLNLFGDSVSVSCNTGYRLVGSDQKFCEANGQWSGAEIQCEQIFCPPPPDFKNCRSNITAGDDLYPINYAVGYVCDKGYIMNGTGVKICDTSGNWFGLDIECYPVSCPKIDSFEHGTVVGEAYTYLSNLTFSCNHGFNLIGSSAVQCMESGLWSSQIPRCSVISCPYYFVEYGDVFIFPDDFSEINVTRSKEIPYIYGDVITIECGEGYELSGESKSHCQISGNWSIGSTVCTPVQCTRPNIKNAVFSESPLTYGSVLTVSCIEGYNLIGETDLICGADRKWEEALPKCVLLACGTPPIVAHAIIEGDNFRQGETITYKCRAGYQLTGNNLLTCGSKNKWLGTLPICVAINCGPLLIIPLATVTAEQTTYQSKAYIECNAGYILKGNDTAVCGADRSWIYDSDVYCAPIDCGQPPEIEYGSYSVDDTTKGNLAFYSCDKGYFMMGASSLFCDEDGSWVYELPKCSAMDCLSPPLVTHATYTTNGTLYLSVVEYTCNDGYTLSNIEHSSLVCGDMGIWEGEKPICETVECGTPPDIKNAHFVLDNNRTDYTSYAIYHCNPGYVSTEPVSYLTCSASGEWNGTHIVCDPLDCSELPYLPHGEYRHGKGSTFGTEVSYKCMKGYIKSGAGSLICTETGQWSSDYHACLPVDCNTPQSVEYSFVDYTATTYQSVAKYECLPGYYLVGQDATECTDSGQWSGKIPTCSPVDCKSPPGIDHGSASFSDTIFKSVATFTCSNGYVLGNSSTLICAEDGNWFGEIPYCIMASCSVPTPNPNSEVVYSSLTYQSVAVFNCKPGYNLSGVDKITCGADGQWQEEFPVCEQVTCPELDTIPNGVVKYANTHVGAMADYSCHTGFEIEGIRNLTCLASGFWSEEPPICIRVKCAKPPLIANARITLDSGRNVSSKVSYSCMKGYQMINDKFNEIVLTCGNDGDWHGRIPSCEIVVCYDLPPDIPHGTYITDGDTYTSQAFYTCDLGYILTGHPTIMCNHLGQWETDDPPECIPVSCDAPPTFSHAFYEGTDFTYGQSVTYRCDLGYELLGTATSVCEAHGNWSAVTLECRVRTCSSVIAEPENGKIVRGAKAEAYIVGDIVEFACIEEYSLVGSPTIRCSESGLWNSSPPQCLFVVDLCAETIEMDNVQPPPPGKMTGEQITVQCQQGYFAVGDMTSVCRQGGIWSIPEGRCQRVYCGKPEVENVQNVMVIGHSYYFGDTVMFMCRFGYMPVHSPPVLTCLHTSEWDGKPECVAQCKQECLNGGFCVGANRCKCMPGWAGNQCQLGVCILPCLHGGQCVAPYKCRCPPGYEGSRCQQAKCAVPCENGGRCLWPNKCQCRAEFFGSFCDKSVARHQKTYTIT